jgi:hypothetical protein
MQRPAAVDHHRHFGRQSRCKGRGGKRLPRLGGQRTGVEPFMAAKAG